MDEFFMRAALSLAREAFERDESPIGCVVTRRGEIIGRGRNERNGRKNALYHAEIIAIDEACRVVGDWRLDECELYVTIEPCPMCAGAIVQARVPKVVFGARNAKAGCAGSVLNILDCGGLNHRVSVVEGVLAEECGGIMTEFFKRFK